jgi:hypothetical protein
MATSVNLSASKSVGAKLHAAQRRVWRGSFSTLVIRARDSKDIARSTLTRCAALRWRENVDTSTGEQRFEDVPAMGRPIDRVSSSAHSRIVVRDRSNGRRA